MRNRKLNAALRDEVVAAERHARSGVMVGTVVGLDESGDVLIAHEHALEAVVAQSVVAPSSLEQGARVVLAFEHDLPSRPIVMGVLHPHVPKRVELNASEEIAIRCGGATITLTREGKISIRGSYLLSRASGLHRILGAVLRLN